MRRWLMEWLFSGYLAELETRVANEVLVARQAAFELGFQQGQAVGQMQGQNMLIAEIGRIHDERRAVLPEVTPEDIARAKKGLVH